MSELIARIDAAIMAAEDKPQTLFFLKKAKEAAGWSNLEEGKVDDLGTFKNMTLRDIPDIIRSR